MGAVSFVVCYGLRWEIDDCGDGEITLLEQRQDPRQLAARQHQLDTWWGDTAVEGTYFLLVGTLVGTFGWEGDHHTSLTDEQAADLAQTTRAKLRAAGFDEEPTWHYQFAPDY